jgi:large subunit ribosomal protein L21
MHCYAEIKGHQFRLTPGEIVEIPALDLDLGSQFEIKNILSFHDSGVALFGKDCQGIFAKATVVSHGKGPKVRVFKKERRMDYQVLRGHRQKFSTIRIDEIVKA